MTYGEWLYKKRDALHIENGEWVVDMEAAPKQMLRDEAARYYGEKLEKAWEELGYERRGEMTIEEAKNELGFKSERVVKRMVTMGALDGDGNGGVSDESVERYKRKNSEETAKFHIEEEALEHESPKKCVLMTREFIEQKIVEAFELGKKEGRAEAFREMATDEEIDVARIVARRVAPSV